MSHTIIIQYQNEVKFELLFYQNRLKTLEPLQRYISNDIPLCLQNPSLENCPTLVCGLAETDVLPVMPSVHGLSEDYPHTHVIQPEFVHVSEPNSTGLLFTPPPPHISFEHLT